MTWNMKLRLHFTQTLKLDDRRLKREKKRNIRSDESGFQLLTGQDLSSRKAEGEELPARPL